MKYVALIFGAIGAVATLILKFWPKSGIDPKISEALKIREEISEQTNSALIKLQKRKLDELEQKIEAMDGKLDSLLWVRKTNPPA